MTAPSIVVVGSVNADLVTRVRVLPAPGETVLGRDLEVLPGGKGANQAVAAARLGSLVALVGAVGTDSFAAPALSGLHNTGVNLSGLVTVDGATGVALVTVRDDGENFIVVVPGANAHVTADRVRSQGATISGAAVVVVQGEIPPEAITEAAELSTGRLVVNLAPVIDIDQGVLLAADPLVVNEHEATAAARMLGCGGTVEPGPAVDAALPAEATVVAALLTRGVRSVVLTIGARGAVVGQLNPDGTTDVVYVPAAPANVVDTTGAGDAFVGALAHGLACGNTLDDAARHAARVAAYSVQSAGAQPSYPWAHDELPGVS